MTNSHLPASDAEAPPLHAGWTPREIDGIESLVVMSSFPWMETHWTRLLHRDLDSPWREQDAWQDARAHFTPDPDDVFRATTRPRTPAMASVMLLGLYVAIYVTVAAVMRLFALDETTLAQPAGAGPTESAAAPRKTLMPPASPIA